MKIKCVEHIAINTINFNESLVFYRDLLGLKQLETVDMDEFSLTYLELPGGGRLELFDYNAKNKVVERDQSEAGLRHLAFEVDEVEVYERYLREFGVSVTLPATILDSLRMKVLLFLDPNGTVIEFCERLK